MSLKLNIGISKKIGLPGYSSLGASCAVEIELDNFLLERDPASFQEHVRHAYAACDTAVDEQLQKHRPAPFAVPAMPAEPDIPSEQIADGEPNGSNGSPSRASNRQLEFARQLATRIHGLGVRRLDELCQSMFARPLAELSRVDASALIDVLKQVSAGQLDLATVLSGAAP